MMAYINMSDDELERIAYARGDDLAQELIRRLGERIEPESFECEDCARYEGDVDRLLTDIDDLGEEVGTLEACIELLLLDGFGVESR